MVNTDKSRQRWVMRKTLEDDIYYDLDTRKVYRNGAHPVLDTSQDVYKLPTFDSRAPLKVYFDFTYLCNLKCRHCISNSSPQVDRKDELSSERIVSIMDELAIIGVLEIAIGGGEPLCHPDILSFLEHSRAIKSNIILTTNGILITSAVAKRLKEYQVSEVRVSFDGSQKVHDNIRGTGNYQKAISAVKLLIRNGVMPVARLTVCNDDEFGLDMLFKDLHAIGVGAVKAAIVEPRGRAALEANQDLFRYKRDIFIAEYLIELAQKYDLKLKLPADLASIPELADGEDLRLGKRKSCGAGLETAYISPYGDVQPCVGVTNRNFGNIRSDSFMSVWTSDSAKTWRQYACSHDSWKVCAQMEIFFNKEILSITEK